MALGDAPDSGHHRSLGEARPLNDVDQIKDPVDWDRTVDLLVVGAGAGGMAAALVASLEGLSVLLCEKSAQVGGTAATSAGTIWIPRSSQAARAGLADPVEPARRYLDAGIAAADHMPQ